MTDKWLFLSRIANSPRTIKSWEYPDDAARTSHHQLAEFSKSPYCPSVVGSAIQFALIFQNQFLNLNDADQKKILDVLNSMPPELEEF